MANRYWVGGTADWDGTAGTKWALTSGGTGGEPIPTSADDVFFDSASGANTVTISAGNTGAKSIDCTGFTGTLAGNAAITVSGSITLVSGMTYTYANTITVNATSTVISAGKTFAFLTVNAVSGTVTLGDAFNAIGNITLTNGTLTATGNVTVNVFNSTANNAGRVVNMGSGLWTLTGTGTIWNLQNAATITINKDTADILLSNTSTTSRTFTGLNKQYNKLTIGGATGTSTTAISVSNATQAFTELASTKTVAHTISFNQNNTRIGAWSITGSAGNVVTLTTNNTGGFNLIKTTPGHLTGIDYLSISYLTASPVSDTWYVGSNSQIPNSVTNFANNYMVRGFFTTQRSDNAVVVLTDTTGSATWSVPSDWNNSTNSIHLIGGGGGGGNSNVSGNNRAAGGGGGGGGYTRLNNQSLTIGASIPYQAGAAGAIFSAGGTTSWNSGAATAGGGGGGASTITPTSTGGAGGIGSTYNGGAGGAGSTSTVAGTGNGGGGGGGAGGPNGAGGKGGNGFASTTQANISGGGGGGNGGGTNGANGSSATGGTGGNNSSGVGGGASRTSGVYGGGGGGAANASPGAGSSGIEFFNGAGSGGGNGGWMGNFTSSAPSGFYGAGAGGDAVGTNGVIPNLNTVGSQGAIIITYVPTVAVTGGNMFFMFS